MNIIILQKQDRVSIHAKLEPGFINILSNLNQF